jgi:hypothetical protein
MVFFNKLGGKNRKNSNKNIIDIEKLISDDKINKINSKIETDDKNFTLMKEIKELDNDIDKQNEKYKSIKEKQKDLNNYINQPNYVSQNEKNIYEIHFDDYIPDKIHQMDRDFYPKHKIESNNDIPKIKQFEINKPNIPISKLSNKNKSMINIDDYNEEIYIKRESRQSKRNFNSAGLNPIKSKG